MISVKAWIVGGGGDVGIDTWWGLCVGEVGGSGRCCDFFAFKLAR